jgi:hypothetical protein
MLRHDSGDCLVLRDLDHRHQIPLAGDGIDLRNALYSGQLRSAFSDSLRLCLDQYDGGNHGNPDAAIFGGRRRRERQDI